VLPVTLWVYGKKTSANALIDSGASTNFISKRFVANNHLVTNKLQNVYPVFNADGTRCTAPRLFGTDMRTQVLE
jgi:hypothetical protein